MVLTANSARLGLPGGGQSVAKVWSNSSESLQEFMTIAHDLQSQIQGPLPPSECNNSCVNNLINSLPSPSHTPKFGTVLEMYIRLQVPNPEIEETGQDSLLSRDAGPC